LLLSLIRGKLGTRAAGEGWQLPAGFGGEGDQNVRLPCKTDDRRSVREVL